MKLSTTYYNVFVRDWWQPNPAWPDGREPGAGPKTYLLKHVVYEDARERCKEYNDSHDPGPMSRKAEFEVA